VAFMAVIAIVTPSIVAPRACLEIVEKSYTHSYPPLIHHLSTLSSSKKSIIYKGF